MREDDAARDRLVQDYGTVLRESAVLTTFAGILFGFLFNTSVSAPDSLVYADRISLLVALLYNSGGLAFRDASHLPPSAVPVHRH
ncbi:MAG TPA: hypothetical protein VD736_03630 [Nitrososphaera sp.]|nr:hypothetical protein [Nitrososphaera sp.]